MKQLSSLRRWIAAAFVTPALLAAAPAALAQEYGYGDEGAFYDEGFNWFDDTRGEMGTYGYGYGEGGEYEGYEYSDDFGLYGDTWTSDEFGYYDSDYGWTTDDEGFTNWYGETGDDWWF